MLESRPCPILQELWLNPIINLNLHTAQSRVLASASHEAGVAGVVCIINPLEKRLLCL